MHLSASEAARQTGRSKPAILKAIKSGRISAMKDEGGNWAIDPAELFRVFKMAETNPVTGTAPGGETAEAELRAQLEGYRQLVSAVSSERDHLRQRLEAADQALAEERAERRQLTRLLTDQRAQGPQVGRWWARLLGRG
jgi:excisionase family DNA binding protein